MAFEIAGRGAMREVADRAGIKLLEPIMKVEVVTPEDYLGDVIGDLNSRRGQIQGTDTRGNAQAVEAIVPLANMFGYVNELRSFTQGRAQYTMQFSPLRRSAGQRGAGGQGEACLRQLHRLGAAPDSSGCRFPAGNP